MKYLLYNLVTVGVILSSVAALFVIGAFVTWDPRWWTHEDCPELVRVLLVLCGFVVFAARGVKP